MPKRKEKDVEEVLTTARKAGAYMVAIWTRNGEKLDLWWKTSNFLQADFLLAITQLDKDLKAKHAQQ